MDLREFLAVLPTDWVLAPIYRKGAPMKSGKLATGKNPFEPSFDKTFNKHDVKLACEKNPTLGAVGLFTGTSGGGIAILDCDKNLGVLKRKWGASLDGAPVVTSTRANAAKYIFRVPEALWGEVSGFSHSDEHADGYEVLWGPQGLVYGDYPGSSDGKYPAGSYSFEGDPDNVPVAPEWLLAEMRAAKKPTGFLKNKTALDLSDRTEDEIAEIISDCTHVIQNRGSGQREHWVKIGMAIHSVLPNEKGLELWSDWSRKDAEFADEWEKGNPCEHTWKSFKPGAVGLGSLIWQADRADPKRTRFTDPRIKQILETAEAKVIQSVRTSWLNGEELLKRAKELEETVENPALLDQGKHLLALEAGRRDSSSIDRLLDADLSYERTGGGGPKRVMELDSTAFEYLIPGLLPKPWTLLIHADGGTGKTAMCQTLAKHISKGVAFNIHGGLVDVPAGKVLWLNGDQNERILRRQFEMIDAGDNIDVVGEWDMQWYRRFCKYQNAAKYDMVVIDSLDGCNDSNPYEENRREFALPLKRLARRNGVDFPACSILIIHHNTKEGKFRGTSAIKAAVDETWNMRKVSLDELMELSLPLNTRMVSVEKSRDDREGQRMVFSLMPDYTYKIGPVPETEHTIKTDTPNQHTLDVLDVMRRERKAWTAADLAEHESVGGDHRKRAIRYGLQRLEQQALIERCAPPVEKRAGGRPPVYYRACGTNVPAAFSKRGIGNTLPESVSKPDLVVSDCSLIDKGDCQNTPFVKTPEGSTAPGTSNTETSQKGFDNRGVLTNGFVNEEPVPDCSEGIDADLGIYKEMNQSRWD